jgi:hypothetical protein
MVILFSKFGWFVIGAVLAVGGVGYAIYRLKLSVRKL